MALQFCIGASGAGKSKWLYEDVIRRSIEEPQRRFFILVPDQFTMQTQKELVLRHPKGGIMNIDVLSFGRLTHRIFEETGGGRGLVLDDTGKSLILRRIAAKHEQELTVIASHIRRIGYIHEVKSAISEFMQYGIGSKELEELVEYSRSRGSLYYKLKDLQILYRAFQESIDGRFVTTEGQLGLLAQALDESELIKGSVILFDGFTGFTPIQNQVIQKLLQYAEEVRVAVIMDGSEEIEKEAGEQNLFSFSRKLMKSLCRLAEEAGVPVRENIILNAKPVWRFADNPSMAHLEQELFRYRNRPYEKEQDAVHLLEASTPAEEVRQICLEIRRLIRQKGYQYRDIAVVAGDLSVYADYVREEFERFGIPCYVDATKGIVLNPFIEYIRSAWKILLKNFTYESVFHFLRSGLADVSQEEADILENYVLRYGIRGKKAWSGQFVRRSLNSGQEAQELNRVNEIREKVMEILQPLLSISQSVLEVQKTKTYISALYEFLLKSHAYEKLLAWEAVFEEAGDMGKAKEFSQIYRLVMELLEQIYDLIGEEEMSMQEFADIVDAGFGEITVGTIPQNVDRILVGDMERTRLKEIKVLFFLGVNDGNIPKNGSKGGIISDIDREFLAQGKWEMAPSPRQQMYIQRLYLYMNMTKPSERLYLSYVKVNGEGKAVRPAYLIGTVRRLFPKLKIEVPEKRQQMEQIEVLEDGFLFLSGQLREYAKGNPVEQEFFYTLYETYQENAGYQKRLDKLKQSAFFRYCHSPLGEQVAHALYGSILKSSVSRLEQYASCAYSYFLQYGLSLKEREVFGFEAVDMGTLFHGILEQFSRLLEENGLNWFSFTRQQGQELLTEAVEAQTAVYGGSILFSSAKYRYVITRIQRILERTIFTLQSQLKKGRFAPEHFEVSFSSLSDIDSVNISLSEKERMHLQGRIDRIDTCREKDAVYVKVIDYKSGDKKLDIAAIYYGLQLQLVVYMNAAVEMIGKKETNKRVVPAAMLYYHVSDPFVKAEEEDFSEEMLNQKIRESLRMSGAVNEADDVIARLDEAFEGKSEVIPVERKKDGSLGRYSDTLKEEELLVISNYVNAKIKEIGKDILQGKIEKKPYAYDGKTGCDHCAYRNVCGFGEQLAGYEQKQLLGLSKDEALKKMQQQGEE